MIVLRLGRSINYININEKIPDRVILDAILNDPSLVVNEVRLGRSIYYI